MQHPPRASRAPGAQRVEPRRRLPSSRLGCCGSMGSRVTTSPSKYRRTQRAGAVGVRSGTSAAMALPTCIHSRVTMGTRRGPWSTSSMSRRGPEAPTQPPWVAVEGGAYGGARSVGVWVGIEYFFRGGYSETRTNGATGTNGPATLRGRRRGGAQGDSGETDRLLPTFRADVIGARRWVEAGSCVRSLHSGVKRSHYWMCVTTKFVGRMCAGSGYAGVERIPRRLLIRGGGNRVS